MSGHMSVVTTANVRSYFQESVLKAMETQGMRARDETVVYLINMLSDFARTDRLYEWTPDGYTLRPLAVLYSEALYAKSEEARNQALRRLGDIALFIAGIFADSLQKQSVNLDYYIAMGGNAYGYLSDRHRSRAHRPVFGELSSQFTDFVDILSSIGSHDRGHDNDIIRLYERWLNTGSKRSAQRLSELGIQVTVGARSERKH